ncbi:MAG: glycyl-radical enzyme activating protein [Clostridia bacterium]|nr:glycyl-radical enzyme activating protein [Clostridia bacterium]
MELKGRIFDIQRFSVHDGPGIRTTVFMKGCSLHCPWCHNPEGLSYTKQPQFFKEECIGCGSCCGEHSVDKAGVCPANALQVVGRDISAEELLFEILCDKDFYGDSGGVTFSGGECLLQYEFVTEMLRLAKAEGISTAVDTSGAVNWKSIEATLNYTDIYLYDVKCATSELHEKVIGTDNRIILENLNRLDESGAKIWIRIPVIPDFNDNREEIDKIAEILSKLKGVERATLIPYHTLGKNKYETIGMSCHYNTEQRISHKKLEEYKEIFRKKGIFTE